MSVFLFYAGPRGFVSDSFAQAARAFSEPPWSAIGPFVPWIAALVGLGVVWLVSTYLDRRDSDAPGTGIDLPFVGNDADGEED